MKLYTGINTEKGLRAQMTLYVTGAVLAVSAVILAIAAPIFRNRYERNLDRQLSDAIAATTSVIEKRMIGIEDATRTMASMAALSDYRSIKELDTTVTRALKGMGEDVRTVSIVLERGRMPGFSSPYECIAYYDAEGNIRLHPYTDTEGIEGDPTWGKCYIDGQCGWSDPDTELVEGNTFIYYFCPITDTGGRRFGVAYAAILESHLTSLVTKYKARKDVDVSIYSADGKMIVAPDDYILELAPEEMIVQERTIEHLGWKMVFSVDKRIVEDLINKILLAMTLLILLTFIVMTLAIVITVRYVAEPFVRKQQKTESDKAAMDREMQLATSAQNTLVPHDFPAFPQRGEIDLHACLHPARKVGGDLYDYFLQDDRLYFCIGDVSGKGVQAALFMAAAHYLFRSVAGNLPAAEAVQQMNRSLCTGNDQCMFITFWTGCLDLRTGIVEYINAGHNAPVLVHDGKASFLPGSGSIPLGVWEDNEYTAGTFTLESGDTFLLYTDGVSEAMDQAGQEFGNSKTIEAVGSLAGSSCADIVAGILEKVRAHAGGADQSDDITMLCIKYNGNKN